MESLEPVQRGHDLLVRGRRDEATAAFLTAWEEASSVGDDAVACAAAHMLGVVEPNPPDWKVRWHRLALESAERVADGRVDAWLPSLHLNLGNAYRLVGKTAQAVACYERARAHLAALDGSPYADAVRAGVARALEEIRTASA